MRSAAAVLGAVVGLALAPGPAVAAPRLLDAGPIGATVRGDGVRYIASASAGAATAGPVTVLDTRTGARSAVPTPANCYLADIHRATILWSCPPRPAAFGLRPYGTGVAYNLLNGGLTALGPPVPSPQLGMPDAGSYQAIGDRWAEIEFSGYHYALFAYVDRRTGATVIPRPTRRQVADLDRFPLVRRLCAGQLRPYVPDEVSPVGGVTLGALATAGRWAAATTYADAVNAPGRVELQRCGAAPRTLRVCRQPVLCSQPVIAAHVIAWVEDRGDRHALVARSLGRLGSRVRIGPVETLGFANPITPLLVGERLYLASADRLMRAVL